MTLKRDPSKALQVGFLALLIVSAVQVSWWIYDHVQHTLDDEQRFATEYRNDAAAVTAAYSGAVPEDVAAMLPHLAIEGRTAEVLPQALAALADERAREVNRFLWEGGFFLAVLLGGMVVLTRTIRHDAELRRRQQNFLAAVSHEFKSPLASIRLASETLVLRSHEPDSQRLGRRILEDVDRLLRMVDNLLDTTRLEEGRQRLEPTITPLHAAAEAAVAEIAERARLGGIDVRLDVPRDLAVSVDPSALETVLRNLLDNAVKACVAGHGRAITVRAAQSARGIELAVIDDGLGFPPEDAAMIFEKFHRLGDELRRSMPGTGLGLYIVRRLVELSGGRIEALSEGPGRGATITIRWPSPEPKAAQ
jgi:signal transduction histidine kinase